MRHGVPGKTEGAAELQRRSLASTDRELDAMRSVRRHPKRQHRHVGTTPTGPIVEEQERHAILLVIANGEALVPRKQRVQRQDTELARVYGHFRILCVQFEDQRAWDEQQRQISLLHT